MRRHVVLPLLGMIIAVFAPSTSSAQTCSDLDGSLANDLCWMNRFASGNYAISAAQASAFQAYNHGPDAHIVSRGRAPWGGFYFPWVQGGIAWRWQRVAGEATHPTLADLNWSSTQQMDSARIARLSPAEKLDLISGNQDFRITQHELRHRGPLASGIQAWEGFCNGIRAAGALTPEPLHAVRRVTTDGRIVIFEPTDIKALLGAAFFYVGENNNYAQIGTNLGVDPHPGSFDIALRMILGVSDRVFFFDTNTGYYIFNHTIVGYDRKILSQSVLQNGSRNIQFETTVYHMGEVPLEVMGGETSNRVASLASCCTESDVYSYELMVDSSNRITGGRWLTPLRPDAVWFASGPGDDRNHSASGASSAGYRGNPHMDYSLVMSLLADSRPASN